MENMKLPRLAVALAPVAFLIFSLILLIITRGASSVSDFGPWLLLMAAAMSVFLSRMSGTLNYKQLYNGMRRSFGQLLPAVPVLVCISMVAATWMLSGIVPTMIYHGLRWLNADIFLFMACGVCAFISVLLGSSWTTIATIGVAFMGIGTALGYSDGWIAGAIISGAYFGDKVSPLSDTTVIASSTCGVDLFSHIRFLMTTAAPAMGITLLIFLCVGFSTTSHPASHSAEIADAIAGTFNLSPWLLVVPVVTGLMCAFRVKSVVVLAVSAAMGLAAMYVFQPQIVEQVAAGRGAISMVFGVLFTETESSTGSELLDSLVATGGVQGMLPTVLLVMCAMVFGGVLIGTGMLASITRSLNARLSGRGKVVGATVGTGLLLNSCTADQYLSIIVGGNIYRDLYARCGYDPRLLSRSLEDSISVTSPIIPWNSCGVTQSTVLGVSTVVYFPYCFFNYLTPLISILLASVVHRERCAVNA